MWRQVSFERPLNPRAYANLGVAYQRNGMTDSALDAYMKAFDILLKGKGEQSINLDELCSNLSGLLTMKGRYAEAEHYGREALKVRPDSVGALQNLAVALIGQGRLDEAEAFLNQAISLQPDKPVLHRIMNSLREHAGRDK